jgi:hypothetical protein
LAGGSTSKSWDGLDTSIIEVAGDNSAAGESNSMSVFSEKGTLCGNGDISIESTGGAGEDEGRGGVVIISSQYQVNAQMRAWG